MNREIKEEWLKRLRSGEYKQAKSSLCTVSKEGEKSYCCLGILTEIVNGEDAFHAGPDHYPDHKGSIDLVDNRGNDSYPSKETLIEAGWDTRDVAIEGLGNRTKLTRQLGYLNDKGLTFEDIASIIEKHL